MSDFSQSRTPEPLNEVTKGQRIAGAILILNAGILLAEAQLVPEQPRSGPAALQSPATSFLPVIIDIALGISLLRGSRTLVPWVLVRSAFGILLNIGLHVATGDWVAAVVAAVYFAALLALLIGDASPIRRGISLAGIGFVWLLEIIGIITLRSGSNPVASLVGTMSGSIESEPVKHVAGEAYAYSLDVPNDRWYLRTPEAAKKDNPAVDKWLTRPDVDAHIVVIAEHTPGSTLSVETYTEAILKNFKAAGTSLSVERREPWGAHPENGRFVEATASTQGVAVWHVFGLVAADERALQVHGFAPSSLPADVKAEMGQIIDSLKPPPGVRVAGPDLEDGIAGRIAGVSYGYSVETPNAHWHVRKAEVAKTNNPLVDRWLVRLDMDAHVLIVAEHEPGSVIPIDPYADTILSDAKDRSELYELVERKPWRSPKESGRFAHTRSKVNEVSLEHYYGLLTQGDRAFQIIGFAPSDRFDAVKTDILHILNSFTLPAREEADAPRKGPGSPRP